MIATSRRLVLGGTFALLLQAIRDAVHAPEPVRAARRKSVKFDITASQFRDDCKIAGGMFVDRGSGNYACCFTGWCMECSENTKTCRIACDPGVKCLNGKHLPGRVTPALVTAVNQLPSAPETNAPPDAPSSGPPNGPGGGPGNVFEDDPALVAQSR